MGVAITGMERGLPMLNPHPMLMPRPNHGTMVDMDGHTMVAITGMERGLPMLNLPLMLMPSPNRGITAAMDMDGPTTGTPITERGLLMLNRPLMLMPSPIHGITAAMDMDGPTMVTTGVELIGSKHWLKHSPRTMLRDNRILYN